MGATLFVNISQLLNVRTTSSVSYGPDMASLPMLSDAWLLVEDRQIAAYGSMENAPAGRPPEVIDCVGKILMPAWCDSHSHLVFAGNREAEFVDKIHGLTYAEINARGGGILHSAATLADTPEDQLFDEALHRLNGLAWLGTGAIEIKSGYGLTVASELKMLRVIRRLKEKSAVSIKASFLAAHTYPMAFREDHEGYIRLIIEDMLPVIAAEKLADYMDVFCEQGFFSPAETMRLCSAAAQYGLKPKLHVNQLSSSGAIEAGISSGAVSMDHLEVLTAADIQKLASWKGICTLLPTAAFFLRMAMPDARALINAGNAVALASDFNPGSSPSGNMNLVLSMACIQLKMFPEEAINAATLNGAWAMGLGAELGSITAGKSANLILTKKVPSLAYLPYAFGTDHIDRVMIQGAFVR